MAYLGEADSGATAVALPILNQSGILQLSATSTAEGLTRAGVGAGPGAPYQYYPSGDRTFARMVPHDSLQGAVIASLVKRNRCRSVALLDDGTIYGAGLSAIIADEAAGRRVRIAFSGTLDPEAGGYAGSVRQIKAPCLVYSGDPGAGAVKVVTDAARHNRTARIFVPDALVDPSFADHSRGGIGPRLGTRVTLVGAFRPPAKYPPFGRSLFDRLGGGPTDVTAPNIAAVYAATELALRCLRKVQAVTQFNLTKVNESRRAMVSCALGHGHRSAALGNYRIHADGDWNGRSYSQLRIADGKLVFVRELRPPPLFATPRPVVNPTG
jgi:branched-chain amino acid transport system substrate-binding protein